MTGEVCGGERPCAGEQGAPPSPGKNIAARAEPAILDQPFDDESLYQLRAAVAAHAAAAGIAEGRVRDVVLAVHELAANAVRHGAGQGRVRLWATGDGISCEVTDTSAPPTDVGIDHPDASPGSARWPVQHGHGLWLIEQVADQVSVKSGPAGTVAVVSFRSKNVR